MAALFATLLLLLAAQVAMAQSPVAPDPDAGVTTAAAAKPSAAEKPQPSLAAEQKALAEDYARLEQKLRRLAQVSSATDPARAALLKQAFSESKQRYIAGRLDELSHLLGDKQPSGGGPAFDKVLAEQAKAKGDLAALVELLQNESQTKSIDDEAKRLREITQRIGRIIRTQEGIAGQTESTADPKNLAKDQAELADKTGKLGDEADAHEKQKAGESAEPKEGAEPKDGAEPNEGAPKKGGMGGDAKPIGPRAPDPDASPTPNGQSPNGQSPGKQSSKSPMPGEGSPQDAQQSPDNKQEDGKQDGEQSLPRRLRDAQQKMKEAQRRLEEAKPKEAAAEQQQALEQLKAAQAALEKILRQMREEQVERTLEALEQRFRSMLDAQIAVYDETRQLDKTLLAERTAEDDIRAGRLGRREQEIELMCQRALALLRDEGSAAALPEAAEQAAADMHRAADLLAQSRTDLETQQTEQDIITALDQILAAVKQAKEDAKSGDKRQSAGNQGNPPGEAPLVDMIAELKMLRTMQTGVNRRIKSLTEQMQANPGRATELRGSIEDLGRRQKRIVHITRDIVSGKTE